MEKRIETLFVVMGTVIAGIIVLYSYLYVSAIESYDLEIYIYVGAALIIYFILYLVQQGWKWVLGAGQKR